MKPRINLRTMFGGATFAIVSLAAGVAFAASNGMARSDEAMLKDIAEANMAEVATGKLAVEKSSNDSVKKFGQMMVDDHSKALGEVQALAQTKDVKLPTEPSLKHKAVMRELQSSNGESFDSRYIKNAGLNDHQATEKLLKKTQASAKDADLKALAGKMLPVVQMHLQHAQQLSAKK